MKWLRLRAWLLLGLTCWAGRGGAEILVLDSTETVTLASFRSASASFGQPLPSEGLHGKAVKAEPIDGCHPILPPPRDKHLRNESKVHWMAVVSRYGGCTFEQKVRNAQDSNYSAVIVFNINSDKIIPMGGDDDSLIPSVFIGYNDGDILLRRFVYKMNPFIWIVMTNDKPFDINSYLLPFAVVVGICFLIMLGIVIFKCVQDYRRKLRHRLPKSALRKLPIHKFKQGDPYETCCICLDDFIDGDKLRILPCSHGYHAKCIDPWLVKNQRICPQCRKKVFASNDRGATLLSASGSDSEDDERAPLLRNQSTSYGGAAAASSSAGWASASTSTMPTAPVLQARGPVSSSRSARFDRTRASTSDRLASADNCDDTDDTSLASSSDDDDDDDDDGIAYDYQNASTGHNCHQDRRPRASGRSDECILRTVVVTEANVETRHEQHHEETPHLIVSPGNFGHGASTSDAEVEVEVRVESDRGLEEEDATSSTSQSRSSPPEVVNA